MDAPTVQPQLGVAAPSECASSEHTRAIASQQRRASLTKIGGSAFDKYAATNVSGEAGGEPRQMQTSIASRLSRSLLDTYGRCAGDAVPAGRAQGAGPSPAHRRSPGPPPRILTKPSEGVHNGGHDNENWDLIISVSDEFMSSSNLRYTVHGLLGQGTFGQVVDCFCEQTQEHVAVKVIKNQSAYYHQARVEIGVLQYLNRLSDPDDTHNIVRLRDFFLFRNHLCLVFELLSVNLYELIKHNQFRGLSINLVRVFIQQILDALVVLRASGIIHCDLKPENVLLKGLESGEIKVIDFGSACFENRTVYSYIQSRFYRSPEVVLGYPYNVCIDMWSLGCMAAELFLGLPLFPGASEHDLLTRVVETLGSPPAHVLAQAKHAPKYFKSSSRVVLVEGRPVQLPAQYVLRDAAEFEALTGQKATVGKRYIKHTRLPDIIGAYPLRAGLSDEEAASERRARASFLDFLLGVLDLDPATRWTPRQAAQHPFVTGQRFDGPFQPQQEAPEAGPRLRGNGVGIPARNAAHGVAASPYSTQAAALLATSPHVQAHAAAMAALQAQLSPSLGSYPGGSAGARGAATYSAMHAGQAASVSAIAAAAAAAAASYGSYQRGSVGFGPMGMQLGYSPNTSLMQVDGGPGGIWGSFTPGSLSGTGGRVAPAPTGTYGSYSSMGVDGNMSASLGGPMSASLGSADVLAAAMAAASAAAARVQQTGQPLEALRRAWVGNTGGSGVGEGGQGSKQGMTASYPRTGVDPLPGSRQRAALDEGSSTSACVGSGTGGGQFKVPPPRAAAAASGAGVRSDGEAAGGSEAAACAESVSPSPADWDPLYSDDQLLAEEPSQQGERASAAESTPRPDAASPAAGGASGNNVFQPPLQHQQAAAAAAAAAWQQQQAAVAADAGRGGGMLEAGTGAAELVQQQLRQLQRQLNQFGQPPACNNHGSAATAQQLAAIGAAVAGGLHDGSYRAVQDAGCRPSEHSNSAMYNDGPGANALRMSSMSQNMSVGFDAFRHGSNGAAQPQAMPLRGSSSSRPPGASPGSGGAHFSWLSAALHSSAQQLPAGGVQQQNGQQ